MPRFAANLSMMYTEHAFLDRFAAAARDGFRAVEYLFPYAFDRAELAQRLDDAGLAQVLFNAPPGDWDAGERGIACLPGREDEFRRGFAEQALPYAAALNCPRVHVMAGLAPEGADRAALSATYLANLAWAASQAEGARRRRADRADQHARHPRLLPQPPGRGARHRRRGRRGQPQGADGPLPLPDRRGRPGHEAAPLPAGRPRRPPADRRRARAPRARCRRAATTRTCSRSIDELGWDGWIGCEYRPRAGTSEGLGWFAPWRAAQGGTAGAAGA